MNDAEQIATGLDKCRRNGPGNFIACCPAHDDKNPSLSITDVDGMVLFYCFAGCSQAAVIEALKAKGLWPNEKTNRVNDRPYYSMTDLLEMHFYAEIANAEKRPLSRDEYNKLLACKFVLKSRGIVV